MNLRFLKIVKFPIVNLRFLKIVKSHSKFKVFQNCKKSLRFSRIVKSHSKFKVFRNSLELLNVVLDQRF